MLQIFLVLFIVNIFFQIFNECYYFYKKSNLLPNSENIYLMYDNTSYSKIDSILNNNDFSNIKNLERYINNDLNLKTYILSEDTLFLNNNKNYNKMIINDNSIDYYNLELDSGSFFDETDYTSINELTPVVIGKDLSKKFKLNQVFSDYNGDKFIVKGILKNNSFVFNLKSSPNTINLNNTFLVPIQCKKYNSNVDFDKVLNGTSIETTNISSLSEIIKKSNELGLYDFHFKKLSNQIEYTKKFQNERFNIYFILFILNTTFLFVSIYSTIIQYINKYIKEFTIHIICGSTYRQICFRIFLQLEILFLINNFIIFIIFKDLFISLLVTILSLILLLIIILMLYRRLRLKEIINLLKGI